MGDAFVALLLECCATQVDRRFSSVDGGALGGRDYGHRAVVDKLGIKAGHVVAMVDVAWELDRELRGQIVARAARVAAGDGETADVAVLTVDQATDATTLLIAWKGRIKPAGGIWLLSPKRGRAGYVDQRALIAAGLAAGLVDNKSCSVSDSVSALRLVIRLVDRAS